MENEAIAGLRATQQELQKQVDELKAASTDETKPQLSLAETELRAVNAELDAEELRARNAEQNEIIRARNKTEAENAVKAAVQRGAILPKDDKTKTDLIRRATADPSFLTVIAGMQGGNSQLATRMTGNMSRIQVGDEDPGAVYGKMAQITAQSKKARKHQDKLDVARDFFAIYAAEFRGTNRERLLSFPMDRLEDAIFAADVTDSDLGTLSGTLVVQRTLELLKFTFPSLASFTTDFTSEQAQFNQTIITRTVGIPPVVDYNVSTGWATGIDAPVTTDVPVTIDKHKGVPIAFNEQIMASTVRRLFDEQAPAQAYALAKQMVDDLYVNITDANFTTNQVTALAGMNRAAVISAGITLDLNGVPAGLGMRTLLLYPTYFGALESDAAIVSLAAFQKPELITNPTGSGIALAIPVESFNVLKAPNLPTNNGNIVGFGGSKSALVIAARMPNDYTRFAPGVAFGNIQTVTDPDLGLSVMLVQYSDHTLATGNQRISLMYGTAAGQGLAGVIIKAHTGSGSGRVS